MKSKQIRRLITGCAVIFLAVTGMTAQAYTVEEPPLATPEEVTQAFERFKEWATAYETGEYRQMWYLTDPRMRKWTNKRRWPRAMKRARDRAGAILSYEVDTVVAIPASKIPCTEMGHCFRKGVQYVFILIRSAYEKAAPAQPEWIVMAKSDEGWKFGGGTFPNLIGGETGVILDRDDEDRYKFKGFVVNE